MFLKHKWTSVRTTLVQEVHISYQLAAGALLGEHAIAHGIEAGRSHFWTTDRVALKSDSGLCAGFVVLPLDSFIMSQPSVLFLQVNEATSLLKLASNDTQSADFLLLRCIRLKVTLQRLVLLRSWDFLWDLVCFCSACPTWAATLYHSYCRLHMK